MVRYGYFQVKTTDGTGYVCVALSRPPIGETAPHEAGFAFCSPKDSFNKTRAREIAAGRIGKPEKHLKFTTNARNTKEAIVAALKEAVKLGVIPSWVAKGLKSKRITLGLTQWTPELIQRRGREPEVISL